MLHELTRELGQDNARTVMIGDTTHDLQMAINAGVAGIGVGIRRASGGFARGVYRRNSWRRASARCLAGCGRTHERGRTEPNGGRARVRIGRTASTAARACATRRSSAAKTSSCSSFATMAALRLSEPLRPRADGAGLGRRAVLRIVRFILDVRDTWRDLRAGYRQMHRRSVPRRDVCGRFRSKSANTGRPRRFLVARRRTASRPDFSHFLTAPHVTKI